MKIGIDFHGVITSNPEFWIEQINQWRSFEYEIHIITGARSITFARELTELNLTRLRYDAFFSISDHLIKNYPEKVNLNNPEHPHVEDKELWDKTKGEYARYHYLDLVIDDTEDYAEYFTTPFMLCKLYKKDKNVGR